MDGTQSYQFNASPTASPTPTSTFHQLLMATATSPTSPTRNTREASEFTSGPQGSQGYEPVLEWACQALRGIQFVECLPHVKEQCQLALRELENGHGPIEQSIADAYLRLWKASKHMTEENVSPEAQSRMKYLMQLVRESLVMILSPDAHTQSIDDARSGGIIAYATFESNIASAFRIPPGQPFVELKAQLVKAHFSIKDDELEPDSVKSFMQRCQEQGFCDVSENLDECLMSRVLEAYKRFKNEKAVLKSRTKLSTRTKRRPRNKTNRQPASCASNSSSDHLHWLPFEPAFLENGGIDMELFNKFLLEFEPGELMYVLKEFDLGLETLADLGCRIEPMYIQRIGFDSEGISGP